MTKLEFARDTFFFRGERRAQVHSLSSLSLVIDACVTVDVGAWCQTALFERGDVVSCCWVERKQGPEVLVARYQRMRQEREGSWKVMELHVFEMEGISSKQHITRNVENGLESRGRHNLLCLNFTSHHLGALLQTSSF